MPQPFAEHFHPGQPPAAPAVAESRESHHLAPSCVRLYDAQEDVEHGRDEKSGNRNTNHHSQQHHQCEQTLTLAASQTLNPNSKGIRQEPVRDSLRSAQTPHEYLPSVIKFRNACRHSEVQICISVCTVFILACKISIHMSVELEGIHAHTYTCMNDRCQHVCRNHGCKAPL